MVQRNSVNEESVITQFSSSVKYGFLNSSVNGDQALASSSLTSRSSGDSTSRAYGLPLYRAVFVVASAALGAGLLNFPRAYYEAGGVVNALSVQSCLILLMIGSFLILGYCAKLHPTTTYQNTIRDFCGPVAQVVCQINVVLYMFGCNVTHMILIGDQLTTVINHSGWYFDRKVMIIYVCCVFILPLCIPEKLCVVSYSSLVSAIGAALVCGIVVSRYFADDYSIGTDHCDICMTSTRVFAAVPVICFGFNCHVTAVAVYAELQRPTLTRFCLVTFLATVICATLYSLTGTFGYLTFDHNVESDILVNYSHSDFVALSARVFIVIVVFSTFAVCHFVGRSAIISLWLKMRNLTVAQIEDHKNKRRVVSTLIWFFSSLGVALFVPTIGRAIAIVGALAAHFIFTFPGLCLVQLMLQHDELTMKKKIGLLIGIVYVVVGMFLFGVTVTQAIFTDIEGKYIR